MDEEKYPGNVTGAIEIYYVIGTFEIDYNNKSVGNKSHDTFSSIYLTVKESKFSTTRFPTSNRSNWTNPTK